MITTNMLITKNTSPNAPLPITVNCSKSSIPILCLCNLIYSVSFFSKFLIISSSSSLDICASCAFLCSARRLKTKHYQLLCIYFFYNPQKQYHFKFEFASGKGQLGKCECQTQSAEEVNTKLQRK